MDSLYRLHYAPDNASLIIRLALEEMGVPYRCALVDRATNAQKSPAYLAINPAGKIPALETPHGVITETGAILLYLSEQHGTMGAAPGTAERGLFLRWLFFIANTLHPDMAMTFYMNRYVADAGVADAFAPTNARVLAHLALVEDAAASGAVPGLAQSTPGVLDCYMVACLRWCALYPKGQTNWFDLDRYPVLKSMAQRFETRASVNTMIQAEGLGPTPFTAPSYPNPPEGVAL